MSLSGVRQEYLYLCVREIHKEGYAISEVCDILKLNRSSYYKWTHRSQSKRELENENLLHEISMIYSEHNATFAADFISQFIRCSITQNRNPISEIPVEVFLFFLLST